MQPAISLRCELQTLQQGPPKRQLEPDVLDVGTAGAHCPSCRRNRRFFKRLQRLAAQFLCLTCFKVAENPLRGGL